MAQSALDFLTGGVQPLPLPMFGRAEALPLPGLGPTQALPIGGFGSTPALPLPGLGTVQALPIAGLDRRVEPLPVKFTTPARQKAEAEERARKKKEAEGGGAQTGQAAASPSAAVRTAAGAGATGSAAGAEIVARAQQRFGPEGARVVNAVLAAEGGLGGAVGDTNISAVGSHGPFQFYGGGGQLNNYAAALGTDLKTAGEHARANPVAAADWAFDNYLGNALSAGLQAGLTGEPLMRRVLAVQNPGALNSPTHYQRYTGALNAPAPAAAPAIPASVAGPGSTIQGVSQNDLGLPANVAAAFCGPAAVIAFARQFNRTPTAIEAMNLAKETNPATGRPYWTEGGMNGPTGVTGMLNAYGIGSRMGTANEAEIRRSLDQGRMVIINTYGGRGNNGHYYQVVGYNRDTGGFILGDAVGQRAGPGGIALGNLANLGYGPAAEAIYSTE